MRRLIPDMQHMPSFRRIALFGGICAIVATSALGYQMRAPLIEGFYAKTIETGFAVKYIDIKGRNHTSDTHILAALNINEGDPILRLQLNDIRERLLNIGWVEDALVRRHLPDRLEIILQERIPLALWETDAGHKVIDSAGKTITEANSRNFTHLTVISGENAPEKAHEILQMLQTEPELFADVWAVQLVSDRRWDVFLRSGVTVRLPESEAGNAWSKLALIEQEKQITARDISTIDLRIPDKLVVEPNKFIPAKGQKT